MPTIKEILQEEGNKGNNELVLFLEGKFWKAYERSAYVLTKLYNFKPSKRFIKLVEQEIISVGFPMEQLPKYIGNNIIRIKSINNEKISFIKHDVPVGNGHERTALCGS